MLSPPDAELVARDELLPGLEIVLDAERLLDLCQQLPSTIEGPLRYSYLRYKPGVSALVGFQVRSGDGEVTLHARAHRRDCPEKLGLDVPHSTSLSFNDQRRHIIVTAFPGDRRLPALRRFADQRWRQAFLGQQLPSDRREWEGVAIERLRYKPERRFVGCLRLGGAPTAVLKLHRAEAFPRANAAAKYLQSRGMLRLPARLGRSFRHQTVVMEWLDGNLLTHSLSDPAFDPQCMQAVGEALGELHGQSGKRLRTLTRDQQIRSVVNVIADVGELLPRLAPYARTLANRIAARLGEQQFERSAIHGDFYHSQVVMDGHQVGVLDLDQAACGDPATDLGNFQAHLCAAVIRGELTEQTAVQATKALLEGYRDRINWQRPRSVELYAAANLLRLTPHPFRNRDPDWPHQIEAILRRAERMLPSGMHSAASPRKKPGSVSRPITRYQTKVVDQFNLLAQPETRFLAEALEPSSAFARLSPFIESLPGANQPLHLTAIRTVRYKVGRRCLIEYKFHSGAANAGKPTTLVGKVRFKGVDRSTWTRMNQLWEGGFDDECNDGISVPRPVAIIPQWRMWLQQKIAGTAATDLLAKPGGEKLATRIAEAIHKLHRSGPPAVRYHGIADESNILTQRVPLVAESNPPLAGRIRRILIACERMINDLPIPELCPIHRDFYPDHVLAQRDHLHLLDLDLYCQGDPGLDIGNFCAHVQEQSLRQYGRADAMADREQALRERFIELTGEHVRESIDVYTTLSLARHIYLSSLFPDRRAFTGRLVELCEARLAVRA